ncbi:MAG TPA: HAD-IC family P-type ATPase, partial [Candidatus Baltobacteraceae bacterium]|nr:HAD-IC family P-type ATPase [Candidatus Baltobacteraceae bacterium]
MNSQTLLDVGAAARLTPEDVLARLGTNPNGLSSAEAATRLAREGANATGEGAPGALAVLARQFANPLLILLAATAIASVLLGERTDAAIILTIVTLSVGLSFINEYRSERAVADLHARVRRSAVVLRDGKPATVDAATLVTGDIVFLEPGTVVPADLRLLEARGLECDESVLTGESLPAEKAVAADAGDEQAPHSCALMGTVVHAGNGRGVTVATGAATKFGRIAGRLTRAVPETTFQRGLRQFSKLLVVITAIVTGTVFILNITLLHHGLFESLLFGLAIAVSLTPQLLPAIVTVSLALGAQAMAKRQVIVKRLVAIEDLGNMQLLFTDKTGTLTEGHIAFTAALDPAGKASEQTLRLGLECTSDASALSTSTTGALDAALRDCEGARALRATPLKRIAELPFDYERRMMWVLVEDGAERRLIVKGAPEAVLAACRDVSPAVRALLDAQFDAGARVIALATRDVPPTTTEISKDDAHDLEFAGLLTFADPPKADAGESIERLGRLGVAVKIVTGDNERVAAHVCREIGVNVEGVLTGGQLETLADPELAAAIPHTTIFARVAPEQKSRLIALARAGGLCVGFLGDGVNDAVALHDSDVGISVDSGTDVAKDAADVVLLTKDLDTLAEGVIGGRRVFANTMKYILMGTSSNFGNMISTSIGSVLLPFLPLLPS